MATIDATNADYAQLRIECDRADSGHRVLWAKIDKSDYPTISQYTWHLTYDGKCFVPQTGFTVAGTRVVLSMGRVILGYGNLGSLGRIDHRNGNTLDCRRANIRIASQEQVLAKRGPSGGSSRYKGVAWDPGQKKWLATFRGKKIGRFHNERDAARAFDEAARAYWGDDAYLNFPTDPPTSDLPPARGRLLAFAIRNCLDTRTVAENDRAFATLHAALAYAEKWS